jgi:glycosyltransferase involved in cell wall biosynthesis
VKRSLSVVLPVCNAERTLSENLQHIFDILSDFTERFEVLVVDEGSTDQTMEIAHDMAVRYPQLLVARSSAPTGCDSSLDQVSGDVVFLHRSHAPFSSSDVRRMWELCEDERSLFTSRVSRVGDPGQPQQAGRSGDPAPRPLALLGTTTPQVGAVTMLRHPAAT